MNTIDRLNAEAAVLTSASRFVRNMGKDGVSFSKLVQVGDSRTKRRNLAAYITRGCPKVDFDGDTTPTPESLARLLLGADFITPEEVAKARAGIVYTDEQLEGLEASFPSIEVIAWCYGNGYMLIPAPPTAMSLLGIRDLNRTLFYSKEGGWCAGQEFARKDKTTFGWLAIRKTPVPNSTGRTWDDQQQLLSGVESVPNAAEMSWFITTYFAVRGVRLFSNVYVRTSSLVSDGVRVLVGGFGARGLVVDYWRDYDRSSIIGLSSARKFPASQQS